MGKTMIVLIDSETGSAAGVFARLVQLERGATVIGDQSAGAVMAGMQIAMASITVSDFVLYNGERLEKVGVKPDIVVVPSAADIALGHDPVLAAALAHVGIQATPARAATILTGQ